MKEAIETRELIVLDGLDIIIRGTYHKTHDDCSDARSELIERGRIGVLFMNSPWPTRAAQGDSAVYWADSFAERGYPSFRLDLPGSGDSEGDPQTEFGAISQGGFISIAAVKIRELVTRFSLEGVVIVDQCSNGISALYVAASCSECKGLVLMDPCFDLPQIIAPAIRKHSDDPALQSCRRFASNIFDPRRAYLLSETASSESTDPPLIRRWKEVASTGIPILIFKASSRKSTVGEFEYFKHVVGLAGRKSQVVINVLDGAHNSFTSRPRRLAIRHRTEQWLDACFL